jgi:F0F1-type ATP synthase assembly protein I
MFQNFLAQSRKSAYKVLYIQAAIVFSIAFLWAIFGIGITTWFAVVAGGSAWILPNFYFIHRCFIIKPSPLLARRAMLPHSLLRKFYVAELLKLALSGLLIIFFLKILAPSFLPFFSGYCGAILSIWLTCWL